MPVKMTICPVFLFRLNAAVIVKFPNASGNPVINKPTKSTLRSVRDPTFIGYKKHEEMMKSKPR